MKTKLLALALVALFAFSSAMAQDQGDMRGSIGLVIGTKTAIDDNGETKMGLGITPAFEYVFADAMSGNLSYDFYFKSDITGASVQISSFNIDYRYYFVTGDTQVYGLAGLALMKAKTEITGLGSVSTSETGLNIGAGANFGLSDSMLLNVQAKYQTPKFADASGSENSNIALNAGVVFAF